jgi:hypothetical protein
MEAVAGETPARRATSLSVLRRARPSSTGRLLLSNRFNTHISDYSTPSASTCQDHFYFKFAMVNAVQDRPTGVK